MKKRKILGTVILCILLCMSVFSLSSHAAVRLNKKTAAIYTGSTVQLKVFNANGKKVKWASSNKKIATVSQTGKVKGIAKGKTVIKAKVGTKLLKCTVTVKKSVTILKNSALQLRGTKNHALAIKEGSMKSVELTMLRDCSFTYNYSNGSVTSVSMGDYYNNGRSVKLFITGVGKGTSDFTISNTYNNSLITFTVTVK